MKYKTGDQVKYPEHLTIWTIEAVTDRDTYIVKSGKWYEEMYIKEVDNTFIQLESHEKNT